MSITWKIVEGKIKEERIQKAKKISPEKKIINSYIYAVLAFIMLVFIGLLAACLLSGCTLNMIMTHTEGSATDVVDSDPQNKPQVEATVKIPAIP